MVKNKKMKKRVGRRGRPVKIPVGFDKAMEGLVSQNETAEHKPKKGN